MRLWSPNQDHNLDVIRFTGLDWVIDRPFISPRDICDRAYYMGGDHVIWIDSTNSVVALTRLDTTISQISVFGNTSLGDVEFFMMDSRIGVVGTTNDSIKCGILGNDLKIVNLDRGMPMGNTVGVVGDRVYMVGNKDSTINTDIPITLLNMHLGSPDISYVGVHNGIFYAYDNCTGDMLIRDPRAPAPSVFIDGCGGSNHVIAGHGIILCNSEKRGVLHIRDTRCTSASYDLSHIWEDRQWVAPLCD